MALHFKDGTGTIVCGCDKYEGRGPVDTTTDKHKVTCKRCLHSLGIKKWKYTRRRKTARKSTNGHFKLACLHCGGVLPERYRYCPHCGREFDNSKEGRILAVCRQEADKLDAKIARLSKNGPYREMADVLKRISDIASEPEQSKEA